MENTQELKKWVEALSTAEKRFIKLFGKARSGDKESQQMQLFDWLNKAGEEEPPASATYARNLPTVSSRLREHILDSLRILNKSSNIENSLRAGLDETAQLFEKKLYVPAQRLLRRTRKAADDSCRYVFVLQCFEWEQRLLAVSGTGDSTTALRRLEKEEQAVREKWLQQRDLQFRHDRMLALVKKYPFHRDSKTRREVREIAAMDKVQHIAENGGYLERALAVNLLGIKDLYERNPYAAVMRYKKLLKTWEGRPEWQIDQADLLLHICKFYQNACLYSPVDWEETRQLITMAYNFQGLSPDVYRGFRRMLHWNQFVLALNTGKLETAGNLIPEIDHWITEQGDQLAVAQQLPFLCNFAVAEFLSAKYESANRFVNRILNMPDREVRKDIREFALVLQAVLQYEMGNTELNEYLTRSGKRHFSNQSFEIKFELAVFRYLDVLNRAGSAKAKGDALESLITELEQLSEQLGSGIPLLGLNEIRMWAEARRSGRTLREVFLDAVRANLEALQNEERL